MATALVVGGCGSPGEPRVVAPRVFESDQLHLTVAPYADRPNSTPRIERVRIVVNPSLLGFDREVTEYRVERGTGKLGPEETLHFTAPPQADAVDVHLTVRHGEETFRVKVPFRWIRTPDAERPRWIRRDEQLREALGR